MHGLVSIIEGALPAIEARVVVARKPRRPRAVHGVRYKWTVKALAHLAGVSTHPTRRACARDAELYTATHQDGGLWRRDITDAQARKIAERLMVVMRVDDVLRSKFPFAPRLGLSACVRCNRNDSTHDRHGVCHRCVCREGRIAKGMQPVDLSRWSPKFRTDFCRICEMDDRPHFGAGLCSACWQWRSKYGEKPARVLQRRRRLQAKGLRRGVGERGHRKNRRGRARARKEQGNG